MGSQLWKESMLDFHQDCRRGILAPSAVISIIKTIRVSTPQPAFRRSGAVEVSITRFPSRVFWVSNLAIPLQTGMLVMWEASLETTAMVGRLLSISFSASEAKWKQACGLVFASAYGKGGARAFKCETERYLQLCGDNNMQVANLTASLKTTHTKAAALP